MVEMYFGDGKRLSGVIGENKGKAGNHTTALHCCFPGWLGWDPEREVRGLGPPAGGEKKKGTSSGKQKGVCSHGVGVIEKDLEKQVLQKAAFGGSFWK